jgi:uncharacterized membrane protein
MDMNDAISYVLRFGVVASVLLVSVGTILLFADNGSNGFSLSQIANVNAGINSAVITVPAIISGLSALQGIDFVLLGLMVLMATPVTRVFLSIFAFLYDRNWIYVIITAIVFIDLMIAVFIVPSLLAH